MLIQMLSIQIIALPMWLSFDGFSTHLRIIFLNSCKSWVSSVVDLFCQAQGNANSTTLHKLNVDIVRVFVDARHHIPQHRSLLLFHQLVDKLGVSRTLCIVGLLIIESSIRTKDVPTLQPYEDGEPQVSYL
jgi:hypothetical protein